MAQRRGVAAGLLRFFLAVCVLGGRRAACEGVGLNVLVLQKNRAVSDVCVSLDGAAQPPWWSRVWSLESHRTWESRLRSVLRGTWIVVFTTCTNIFLKVRGRGGWRRGAGTSRVCRGRFVDLLDFYTYLWVNFHRLGTFFDVVNVQSGRFLSSRARVLTT